MSNEIPVRRFEDPEDFMDFLMEEIQDIVQLWIVWHKFNLEALNEKTSKQLLLNIIGTEHDEQYPVTFPVVEKREGHTIITGLVIENTE